MFIQDADKGLFWDSAQQGRFPIGGIFNGDNASIPRETGKSSHRVTDPRFVNFAKGRKRGGRGIHGPFPTWKKSARGIRRRPLGVFGVFIPLKDIPAVNWWVHVCTPSGLIRCCRRPHRVHSNRQCSS